MKHRISHQRRHIHRALRRDGVAQSRLLMFFSLMVVVLVGLLITSCRIPKKYEYSARYILEVGNNAVESAKVRIFVGGQDFKDMATGVRTPPGSGSGIISLGSGERSMFEMSLHGPKDSLEDNDLVRSFRRVGFFEDKTESPYKSYDYAPVGCRDVPPGADCSDGAWVHQRADGTEERALCGVPRSALLSGERPGGSGFGQDSDHVCAGSVRRFRRRLELEARASVRVTSGSEVNASLLASVALLLVVVGTAGTDVENPLSPRCCDPTPVWSSRLGIGRGVDEGERDRGSAVGLRSGLPELPVLGRAGRACRHSSQPPPARYPADERNYGMTLHHVGVRLLWSVPAK